MMTMKRLSMTGFIEECSPADDTKDVATSGHSRDNTVLEDISHSSRMGVDIQKLPTEKSPPDTPSRSVSTRRRRNLFGNSSFRRDDYVLERSEEFEKPQKPASRRLSLFGNSPSKLEADISETTDTKKPSSQRRRSLFGPSGGGSTVPTNSDDPSEVSESTASDFTTSVNSTSTRRRSFLGSSPSLDDAIGRAPPRPTKSRSGQSVVRESSQSTRRSHVSSETPPRPSRGVDRSKSLDSPKKQASKIKRGSGPGSTYSFQGNESNVRGRRNSLKSSGVSVDDTDASKELKQPRSRRRHSLIGQSAECNNAETKPSKPRSGCRQFLTGGSNHTSASDGPKTQKTSKKPLSFHRRSFTATSSTDSITPSLSSTTGQQRKAIVNPHELVNKSRLKRSLERFDRNMVMDTIAQQVAQDLAASLGSKCSPTNYHGNVGQGESVQTIHKVMMGQKGGTARANLMATRFTEIGIGTSRGKDDLIYVCQLFN